MDKLKCGRGSERGQGVRTSGITGSPCCADGGTPPVTPNLKDLRVVTPE